MVVFCLSQFALQLSDAYRSRPRSREPRESGRRKVGVSADGRSWRDTTLLKSNLKNDFQALRDKLSTFLQGNLERVVFVSYDDVPIKISFLRKQSKSICNFACDFCLSGTLRNE
jgi:hypothetical protein